MCNLLSFISMDETVGLGVGDGAGGATGLPLKFNTYMSPKCDLNSVGEQ